MKKKLLSAFLAPVMALCLIPTSVQAAEGDIPIDEQHFPDANFRSVLRNASFNNGDNILTAEEIANAKEIVCSGQNISDLTGIEYFTDLTKLYCNANKLTSLDVRNNTNLTWLSCNANKLTSLDVRNNTNLTELLCNANQLTSLNVRNNTNLTWLYCGANQLTSLDVRNNTNLTELYCNANQLTSLDVRNNTNLTELYCNANKLTSLDVSKNMNLTGLFCNANQLTSLDVRNNMNLKRLYFNQNSLTSLDITNSPNITSWNPNNNSYAITAIGGVFDLSKLPGNFQVSRASNWNGATEKDGILTITDPSKVTYSYDCDGKGSKVATFTLAVTHHNHSWSDEWTFDDTHHWHNCTAEGCPITENSEKDGYAAHTYEWQSENGQYWQKCKLCDNETVKNPIPEIVISGADKACTTQDYTFNFTLPEGCKFITARYEFKMTGDTLDTTLEDGKYTAELASSLYPVDENSFKITVIAETADGFQFETEKDVTLVPHELTHISAKAPTAAEVGNKEYWYCNVCNKYFSDEDATNEIELADTVLAKLAPIIIDGNGATVTEGEKKALSFTSDAAFEDFIRVEVDGKTLDTNNYTVKSGGIVVTLNANYVSTLSVGEHTLGIVSESGTAKATFTVNKKAAATATATNDNTRSPQTGDTGNMPLMFTLLLAGGGAATVTIIVRKKKGNG